MNINQCSEELRALTDAHANYQLVFDEYRQQRKRLLDVLDKNYNGVEPIQVILDPQLPQVAQAVDDADKTQPYLASKIGKCFNFLKNS